MTESRIRHLPVRDARDDTSAAVRDVARTLLSAASTILSTLFGRLPILLFQMCRRASPSEKVSTRVSRWQTGCLRHSCPQEFVRVSIDGRANLRRCVRRAFLRIPNKSIGRAYMNARKDHFGVARPHRRYVHADQDGEPDSPSAGT